MTWPAGLGAGLLLSLGLAATWPGLSVAPAPEGPPPPPGSLDGEWPHVGGSVGADRFSRLQQITPANVDRLKVAWTAHLGASGAETPGTIEGTPIKIGDTLYACGMTNKVVAIDAETGRVRWRFDPRVDVAGVAMAVCRGVTYVGPPGATGVCAQRVVVATLDARMIAIDARTGRRCPGFGIGGEVNLLDGMGPVGKGYYYQTSPPALVRGRLIIGGRVADGQMTGAPSGVIRAYDAVTGALDWAWDMGRPGETGAPPPGQSYTRGTPNAWAAISGDEALGLAYVPLGNPTPDYVGAHRTPVMEAYGSSLVALDVETGQTRWHFQTTHHDLWDYDLPAPPSLVDFPTAGGLVPALVQPTKRGEFFVLDRRNGKPLVKTVERPVPQGAVAGETLSPTQPYPVGMPSMAAERLNEKRMWGITPLDQLWCRIRFRQARYDGDFTPTGITPSINMPGYFGGANWSGVSIDPERRIMIVNVMHFPLYNRLIPRAAADPRDFRPFEAGVHPISGENWPQAGTPYAVQTKAFVSPLGVPCNQPPYSEIAAIDLRTRTFLWRQPLGTARDTGPFDIPSGLPLRIGVPSVGGTLATRSGLVFIAATQEKAFRAFDAKTGRLLWQDRLPAGGHANPMTYRSDASGRQFVVIPASGHTRFGNGRADLLIAYALPRD